MDPIEPVFDSELKDLVDDATVGKLFDRFVALFHVPLRLFAENGNLILESAVENPACDYLNRYSETRNQCMVVRQRVKGAIPEREGRRIIDVTCVCGLKYLIAAVEFQARVVGKLVIGPYFPAELRHIPAALVKLLPALQPEEFRHILGQLPRYSVEGLQQIRDVVLSSMECIFYAMHRTNVTEQMHTAMVREAYREITEKNRKLEEIVEERKAFERRKSDFLAMVSHELRTPLTSIIGYSDMLAEGIAGEMAQEQRQFVQTIKSKGDELLKIISSILDFSRIDSGRLSVKTIPCDVTDLIETAMKGHREQIRRRGLKLSVKVANDLPRVDLDPEKIVTAISHLVDNAIKFSSPNGVIQIGAHTVASSEADVAEDGIGFVLLATPDMLEISVSDFGVGIDAADFKELFAPFTQVDGSSTREHGGAGIGLAIVKQYVEAHGGRVHVHSVKGEGSNFSIRIPLVQSGV